MENPFTPSFGFTPPLLVGRSALLEDFGRGLDDGPGALERSTIYVGNRGVGKTVMLNAAQVEAQERGWVVVSDTARDGLLESLVETRLPLAIRQLDPDSFEPSKSLSGAGVSLLGSVSAATNPAERKSLAPDLRSQLETLCLLTEANGNGVLLSVDEIHRSATEPMREIAIAFQHLRREGRNIAFVGAGLPSSINDINNDDILTFIRRSDRNELGKVDLDSVEDALRQPASEAGRPFTSDALDVAVEATDGYPFMIQLVGSYCFRSNQESSSIAVQDAEAGVSKARRRIGSLVFEPEVAGLTSIERSFVLAMAQDDGESVMADIAERLVMNSNNSQVHRHNLVRKGVIQPGQRGHVTFTNNAMRSYLRTHSAYEAQQGFSD